jgi:hypothetical protein
MGLNLVIGCSKCKQYAYANRMLEHLTIYPFYKKHWECFSQNSANRKFGDDQDAETETWMELYEHTPFDPQVIQCQIEMEDYYKRHGQNKENK